MTLTVVLALVGAGISAGSYLAGWWVAQHTHRDEMRRRYQLAWHNGVLDVPADVDVRLFADDHGVVRFIQQVGQPIARPRPAATTATATDA